MYDKTLDTFKKAADTGSFTKASEQLFLTHTAVIKQINGLEARLGVRLFDRSSHGITLTPAGQCLYEKTLEIMKFSEKAVQEIQEAYFAAPATIRVGTSLFYPCHVFMDLWDSISDRCPQYLLKVVPIENDEQRFAGLDSRYDFLTGPYNSEARNDSYQFIQIGEYPFCLAMPRKHPLAGKKSLQLGDLRGERLMIMKRGNSERNDQIRTEIETAYPEIELIDIPPQYSIRTFNDCVDKNTILLSLECWKDVHPGLLSVPLEGNYTLPYGIITPPVPEPKLGAFLHTLQELIGRDEGRF